MADAKSSVSLCERLWEALNDLSAVVSDCQTITSEVASDTWGGNTELTLHMVARVLGQSSDKIEELLDMLWCENKSKETAAGAKPSGDDDDDGSPIGEIIRSGGVAMKSALQFPPSNLRDSILLAAANILDPAEQLAPDEEHLADYSQYRKLVATM
ncbi:MAG TPA: hypothetical protein VFL97_09985 [Nitrococcus sp.]|nr:hypothetical protein [Nitrococcus sp.]